MGAFWKGGSPSSPAPGAASAASTRCCSPRRARTSSSTISVAATPVRAPTPGRRMRSSTKSRPPAAGPSPTPTTSPTWNGAKAIVQQAIDEFGRLDVLVNNAGILRDAFIAGMEESQWDAVIAVHLKGHFAMLRHAAAYWKAQSKAGDQPNAAVINTASGSGTTLPNAGQANYGSAKAAIAALTLDRGRGTRALRRTRQRDRADRTDPAHACHTGDGRR